MNPPSLADTPAATFSFHDGAHQRRRILVFLLVLSILLVSAAFYLGILVNGQISTLEANAQTTEAIVNANIRTLAQVQRELLRTAVLLESGENDPAILDLQTSFLTQRMQEAALPYQIQTLGSADLLADSEQLAARFTDELRPLLVAISADPDDADQPQREAALGLIRELELGFNQLVSAGEINRKQQAGQVYDAAVVILDDARRLLWGLAGTILVMFFFFLLTAVYFTRFDRQRATAAATLQQLNRQLQEKTGELVEQRDFALQIMNNMGQGLTVVDEHGRFAYVNPAFAAMVDEKPEALIGRSPVEFTPITDQAVLNAAGATRRRGATTTYETELQCRSGKSVAALITGVPRYRNEEFAGSIAVITDLSDRKAAEAALRASEAEARKLSQVASRTDNLVIIADAQGNAEWVNAAFTRITGYTLAEVIGTRPGRLLQGPETDLETVAYMRRRISAGKGFHCEVLNYARDGRPYWVAIEAQTVHDENGNLTHFIALETDITSRRQTEQRLRAAKESAEAAARAKAAFLATMSHEIRTPLNAVIGLNSLLLSTDLDAEQQQIAETARRSGNLLLMLVNNVLDFSALEAGKVSLEKRPFSLAQCLDETRALLAHRAEEKGVTLTVDLDPALPPFLIGDETRLQQVLINLLGNGVKFTPEGSVQLCVQDAGTGQVAFTVSDSGIGIPPARRERLFQPFSQVDAAITRQYGGSGLGLAISQMLVGLMGGEIYVESAIGEGSTFHFTIPLPAGKPVVSRTGRTGMLNGKLLAETIPLRILVVEDDPVNRQVAAHMLAQLGYTAEMAEDGRLALQKIAAAPYDVICMDIHMPEMDGLTLTRRIRADKTIRPQPRIIAMTAAALEGDRERFIAAGMDGYVSKPLGLAPLAAALSQAATAVPAPPTPQPRSEQPIDLADFAARMGAGQEELLWALVDAFLQEAAEKMPLLQSAVTAGDAHAVRTHAHHLKGSAAGASAVPCAAIAGRLEKDAAAGGLRRAAAQFAQLETAVAAVRRRREQERA